jgi:hypothetical protein
MRDEQAQIMTRRMSHGFCTRIENNAFANAIQINAATNFLTDLINSKVKMSRFT